MDTSTLCATRTPRVLDKPPVTRSGGAWVHIWPKKNDGEIEDEAPGRTISTRTSSTREARLWQPMGVGTQFKCHRIKVEAKSLLLRSPSFPSVGCRSACHFRGPERLCRGRMKKSVADHPVSLPVFQPSQTGQSSKQGHPRKHLLAKSCQSMLCVAAGAVTDVVRTSRRL